MASGSAASAGGGGGGVLLEMNTGAKMPAVGLGTWRSDTGKVAEAVYHALKVGVRHIDCAAVYGNEKEVGQGLKRAFDEGIVKREDIFVTSKLWVGYAIVGEVEGALDRTLSDLGLDYVDLYLIHWPFFIAKGSTIPFDKKDIVGYTADGYAAVWKEMEDMQGKGKTKAIGTSNMTVKKLQDLLERATIPPAANQVEAHPFLQQPSLLSFCREHKIILTAYSPLGSPSRPDRLRQEGDPSPMDDSTVQAVAEEVGKTPAQVLIRWAVQRGTSVIPKSVTPARIEANFAVFDFSLSVAQMERLNALDQHWRLVRGGIFVKEDQTWEDLWEGEKEAREEKEAAKKGAEL